MSPIVALTVVVVGFASGILSGMFGVGGAVLTTPGVRVLGATPIEAVGSTLPAILPGALSGAWRYSKAGMVDWGVALPSGLLGSGFAVGGAALSDHVNGHYLMLLTAAMLLYSGLHNMRETLAARTPVEAPIGGSTVQPDGVEPVTSTRASTPIVAVVGALAGLMAGLLGIGGGVLLVPAYTLALRIPPKRAVATSLVAVAMFSMPAMVTHALLGHINWAFALLLVVGVVPGAQLGARMTIRGSDMRLRLLMGLFFTVLALVYGGAELAAL
ncbi:MAG: uncharacterized protein QOC92_4327 [Acidimicrobiaceae bacterium]